MAFTPEKNEHNHEMSEINIVPLVDVMLVLLIIFMIAAPLSVSGINVTLPTAKVRGAMPTQDRIVLTVSPGGEYYFDKVKIPEAQLTERLKAIFDVRDKKELYIRADRGVNYGRVVDAMSAAKLAGVSKLSMLTQNNSSTKTSTSK